MPGKRRQFSREFKDEAVRLVVESGRPLSVIARELGILTGGAPANPRALDPRRERATTGPRTYFLTSESVIQGEATDNWRSPAMRRVAPPLTPRLSRCRIPESTRARSRR
jgi:transposase-like protein